MSRNKKIRSVQQQKIHIRNQRNRKRRNQTQKRQRLKTHQIKKQYKSLKTRLIIHRGKKKGLLSNDNESIRENNLGKMNLQCMHCGAVHFAGEIILNRKDSFNDCCGHGSVPVSNFDDFPSKLRSLFENRHEYSQEFLTNIRSYNTSISFASFNANLMNFQGRRPGPYCFKVKGSIYYQVNTALFPNHDKSATFAQLFILDSTEANQQRENYFQNLQSNLTKILDKIMRKYNSFVKSYSMMKEEIEKLEKKCGKYGQTIPEVTMCFIPKRGIDLRRYNPQRANEIAAVFTTTADGEIPDTYVTIRNSSTEQLEYISSMDPKVEPWIYPLFYPRGNFGWERDLIQLNSPRRITRSAYIKNLIAIRNKFNPFLRGGRLFQQWLVDNYIKIEKDRTEYCKTHQQQLRSESYQGVMDYLKNKATENDCRIGKSIILPSTFIGSPRNMAQNYQDAMAIVRRYGKPDLFITMTCNPRWNEIQEQLFFGQQPCDRPDIVARVFHLKKEALLHIITKDNLFGKVQAWVYVIEFQKRDLPHLHLLVILKRNYKIVCPQVVDKFISAEIPDPNHDPRLFQLVMQNMIHGPCGDWCFVNGKCSKHFPKKFQYSTTVDNDGYPIYQRQDNGKYYERPNGYVVDNRYVVPYCPFLLKKFNCHCNVEIVSSIKSVKYLFKYIYKGHDAAILNLKGTATNVTEIIYDEIKEHIEARYVGPVEATWRILAKKLQGRSHSVIRLPIHLPNQQNLTIDPDTEPLTLEHIVEQKNMLIDYFSLNQRDIHARKYLYTEIPNYYTFCKTKINNQYNASWKERKAYFTTIGRMYSVSPSQVELFHLRLLLLTIKGAQNFEDLRRVNGNLHSTFTAACIDRGLVADDHEWNRAMDEAEIWMMPYQLRRLFVRILIHCNPLYPEELWNKFKIAMSEDFVQNSNIEEAEIKTLQQIQIFLEEEGKNLQNFPTLPEVNQFNSQTLNDDNYFYNLLQIGVNYYEKLNIDQKEIVDIILKNINNETSIKHKYFYIDGPGGCGKTFIYTTLWYLLMSKRISVQTMAFTGIAATLLPHGKTTHKTFGLPVPLFSDSNSNIKLHTKEAKILEEIEVFIWDEATMAPRYALECIDRVLQDIMNNKIPFGGKIFILGGDFRQLLPVNVNGTRNETINLSIKYSHLWKFFEKYILIKNMRILPEEIEFSKILLQIGDGNLNDEEDNVELPSYCINNQDDSIAEDIFGNLLRLKKYKLASKCAILAARNIDVDEINQQVVELLDKNTERIYTSVDNPENITENEDVNLYLVPEYLNTLNPAFLPPHELRLRKFSIVILIRNLSLHEGLCNGTRLLILELGNNLLRCEILTGDKSGEIIFLNRINLTCENVYPFTFTRRQFPIKLAFAITINKSQGQTFNKIGIDLRKDVFNHGQLYVALSRVRSWKSLKIYIGNQRETKTVKNYVYKELLKHDENIPKLH